MGTLIYKPAIYSVEIEVSKTPDEVFSMMTDLAKWWPEDINGESMRPGLEFELTAGDGHYSKNRVIEFVPGMRFAWITTESIRETDGFDWTGTKMIFELTPHGDKTEVKFTYDGVVLEQESDRLIQICDITIKDFLYHYLTYDKTRLDFTVTIELAKPAAEVFTALTHDVAKWWGGKDLSGNTTRLNDEFIIHHPGAHYSKQKVAEFEPNEKLVWLVTESELSWLQKDKLEWTGTKLIFLLAENDNQTQLRFTHVGLTPDKECYDACSNNGWDIIIRDYLYNYITKGEAHF